MQPYFGADLAHHRSSIRRIRGEAKIAGSDQGKAVYVSMQRNANGTARALVGIDAGTTPLSIDERERSATTLSESPMVSFAPGILPEDTHMRIATIILLTWMIMLPSVPLLSDPPQRDVPAEVESSRRALQGAHNDLEHAGGQWGGHRVAAMKHIEEALKELGEAEKWAREHHDMK